MGDGYRIPWQLKENIRLGKTCSTCVYGSISVSTYELPMCMYDAVVPQVIVPRINTCFNWIDR